MKTHGIVFGTPVYLAAAFALRTHSTPFAAQTFGQDAAPGIGLQRSDLDNTMPYGVDSEEQIIRTLERLTNYVDVNCPIRRIDLDTHQPIDGIASDTHFLEMGIPEDRASFAIGKYEHARIPIIRELTKVLQSAY